MYTKHSEIPAEYRKVILEETGATRVSKVDIDTCNEIIADMKQFEESNANLLNFKLMYDVNGQNKVEKFDNVKSALIRLDEMFNPTAVLFQADRPIRAWVEGEEVNLPKKYNDVVYH